MESLRVGGVRVRRKEDEAKSIWEGKRGSEGVCVGFNFGVKWCSDYDNGDGKMFIIGDEKLRELEGGHEVTHSRIRHKH